MDKVLISAAIVALVYFLIRICEEVIHRFRLSSFYRELYWSDFIRSSRQFLWFRSEVEEFEGGLPLASLALVIAISGFVMYMTNREIFLKTYATLSDLVLNGALCFFFLLLAIGIKHMVRIQGAKVLLLLAVLALGGALVPAAIYTTGNMALANQIHIDLPENDAEHTFVEYDHEQFAYPPESALTPTATDVIYSRMSLVFAGAHPEIIKYVGYLGVLDDAYGLIGLTAVELYHATASGGGDVFLANLGQGAIYMAIAIVITLVFNRFHIQPAMYLAPMLVFWMGMNTAHLHTQLSFVPIAFLMPWHAAHSFERPLNYFMFPVIGGFAFVTSAVDPGQWGPLTNLLLFSAIVGKFVGIGLLALILIRWNHVLQQYKRSELLLAGLFCAIVFKVGGLVALMVFPDFLITEALLATNFSVVLGIGLAVILQTLRLIFKWNWSRTIVPFEDLEFGTGMEHIEEPNGQEVASPSSGD